jgi:hypothetical protein
VDYDRLLTSYNTVVWLHSIAAASYRLTAGLAALLILLVFVALDQLDLSLLQEVCPSVTESTGAFADYVFPLEGGTLSWVAKLMLFHVINS